MVATFFESDSHVFEHCDDSHGYIGEVFRSDALSVFVEYARDCDDKEWLADIVFELDLNNAYGARDGILDTASEYLPTSELKRLSNQFWEYGKPHKATTNVVPFPGSEYQRWARLLSVESLARQLKDPKLYEKAGRARAPELPYTMCIDIAQVYLECSEPHTALQWLERHNKDDVPHFRDKYEAVLADVYIALGQPEKQRDTLWETFRAKRTPDAFAKVLDAEGNEKRWRLLDKESKLIMEQPNFDYHDAIFLVQMEKIHRGALYVLKHWKELNGDYHQVLLPMAQHFEENEEYLAATVCYRKLLDSILNRAISKYYVYGVRYWHYIAELAPGVEDWGDVPTHTAYCGVIRHDHARKKRFWELSTK